MSSPRKSGGLTVALSVQEENKKIFGISDNGGVNRDVRNQLFDKLKSSFLKLGFADILSNPKHGTIEIPGATLEDKARIQISLLSLEKG